MLTQDDTDRMILPLMPVLMGANGEKVEVPSLAEWLGHLPEIGVGGVREVRPELWVVVTFSFLHLG